MAYFWDYIAVYPVESTVLISVLTLFYVGWVKKFWYVYRPSLYSTKIGEWRVRRYIGRIVSFETEDGEKILTRAYAKAEVDPKGTDVFIRIYIGGQPIRRMKLNNKDLWSVHRIPKKLFKREYTMNMKYVIWNAHENCYDLKDDDNPIYIIKPIIFEKSLLKKIDNLDIKASRGSRVSPSLIHSGYFNQHLPIPADEYEENDKSLNITRYAYSSKDMGGHGEYDDVIDKQEGDD